MKRKKKKKKKNNNDNNNSNNNNKSHNRDESGIEILDEDGNYQYRFYGGITSYRQYFNEGFFANLRMAMKGVIKPEWRTPIECKFRTNDRNNS